MNFFIELFSIDCCLEGYCYGKNNNRYEKANAEKTDESHHLFVVFDVDLDVGVHLCCHLFDFEIVINPIAWIDYHHEQVESDWKDGDKQIPKLCGLPFASGVVDAAIDIELNENAERFKDGAQHHEDNEIAVLTLQPNDYLGHVNQAAHVDECQRRHA